MTTLDELITELTKDGKRPDELRVRNDAWAPGEYFIPYFKTPDGTWHGRMMPYDYYAHFISYRGSVWRLYKPKVKRAQYLLHIKGFDPYITDTLHANEKSVQLRNLTGNPFVICERLMDTEREFDE